jgi:hypothetical protein
MLSPVDFEVGFCIGISCEYNGIVDWYDQFNTDGIAEQHSKERAAHQSPKTSTMEQPSRW